MWVIDTCVVLDLFMEDRRYGEVSAAMLQGLRGDGLTISPCTMIELGPAFGGDLAGQKYFLSESGISFLDAQTPADTEAAHAAWYAYVLARRGEGVPKRPLADLLIGGFAANRSGLVTRNPKDFERWFPDLKILDPMRAGA